MILCVLDCFIGSGTTALAAIREGRRYIGIDKEERSVKIAKDAINFYHKYSNMPQQVELVIEEIESKFNTDSHEHYYENTRS